MLPTIITRSAVGVSLRMKIKALAERLARVTDRRAVEASDQSVPE
jgi:hypothetical protein